MHIDDLDLERERIQKSKPVEVASDEVDGDTRKVKKVTDRRVRTLQELAEVCEIDLKVWEIYRWKCSAWQTGMKPPAVGKSGNWKRKKSKPIYSQQFVVMAWMRPRKALIAASTELDELRKRALSFKPAYPAIVSKIKSPELLAEFAPMDHHFGALAWAEETGWQNYDLKIARKTYENAMGELIARLEGTGAGRALLILGNDQQNFDNKLGTTTKGTPQSTDGRYQKVFSVSRDVSIWAIEALLGKFPSVEVVMVSGNHDSLAAWHLGDSLQAWFRNCDRVKIDNRPLFRKYLQFGVCMLMFTHGAAGKLEEYDKVMAAEQPAMWGSTKWREAHTGDKHHRRVVELKGATVRILPSLRPPDAWTSENHYVGSLRAAEAYLWDQRRGLISTATHSILS